MKAKTSVGSWQNESAQQSARGAGGGKLAASKAMAAAQRKWYR